MNLLPKNKSEFSQSEYWNSFFKQRGNKAFEWYGEYTELCGFLHKYIKSKDRVLIVGCGNSRLSGDLYDVGFRNLVNIDISPVVIKQMRASNDKRSDMIFEEMDALNMSFNDNSFSVVLDKGTLDALMPDNEEDTRMKVTQYFNEIERVLRIGGRYICISLLEGHILSHLLDEFTNKGWMVRVLRCNEAERKTAEEGANFTLPVFVVVCTKFKKLPSSQLMLEVSLSSETELRKMESSDALKTLVKEIQEVAMVCRGLERTHLTGKEVMLDVLVPDSKEVKYKVIVVDKKSVMKIKKFAAFVVPQGRETEYLFNSPEGRQDLLESLSMHRLVIVMLGKGLNISMEEVTRDLSPLVVDVTPQLCKGCRISFLTSSNEENGTEVAKGTSKYSGDYIVRDVEENGEIIRKLFFLSNLSVTQSEARMKKVKSKRGKKLTIDVGYLSCQHHYLMTLGACAVLNPVKEGAILIIGLGGGGLCGYVHKAFSKSRVTAVDLDPAMIKVSSEFFGLNKDSRMDLVAADGIDFMKEALLKGSKYDVIMFDVDNKDLSVGMSCPPKEFVDPTTLQNVHDLLNDSGIFILNLVCRNSSLRDEVYEKVGSIFKHLLWTKVPDELGEVIYTWRNTPNNAESSLREACISFEEIIVSNNFSPVNLLKNVKSLIKVYPLP